MLHDKVLLVNPTHKNNKRAEPRLPSVLGYMSQALENNGIEHTVIDMNLGYSDAYLLKAIKARKPSLVVMPLETYHFKNNYVRINALKKAFPRIKTAVFGPHISLFREQVLNDCAGLDYGLVLEGETTLVELCQGSVEPGQIKGLVFRDNDKTCFTGERDPNQQLDLLGFPKYKKFELHKYPGAGGAVKMTAIPLVTSRGCTARCGFCPVQMSIGRHFRFRSAESVLNEMMYWYLKDYRNFWIADDNFTLARDRVLHICRLIRESNMKGLWLGCGGGLRADMADKEVLSAMQGAGFKALTFGIEGGCDKTLKALGKSETLEMIENSLKLAFDLGFEVSAFFMIGAPEETAADSEETLKLAAKYPFAEVRFNQLVPFPGTEVFDWVEKFGRFIYKPEEYLNDAAPRQNRPVFCTEEFSEAERKEVYERAETLAKEVRVKQYSRKLSAAGVPGPLAELLTGACRIEAVSRLINKRSAPWNIKDGFQ